MPLPRVSRPSFTIECVAKSDGSARACYIWMRNPSWVGGALVGQAYGFNVWYPWAPLGGGLGRSVWSNLSSISLCWEAGRQVATLDGVEVLHGTGNIDSRNVLSEIYIGQYNGSIVALLNVHCVRLYSRALTSEEVIHNYLIDRERFDLP